MSPTSRTRAACSREVGAGRVARVAAGGGEADGRPAGVDRVRRAVAARGLGEAAVGGCGPARGSGAALDAAVGGDGAARGDAVASDERGERRAGDGRGRQVISKRSRKRVSARTSTGPNAQAEHDVRRRRGRR